MEKIHYTHNWIVNPVQPLTVFLIGAGGTGSNLLSCLAIINKSLIALGHPGFSVTVFDDDKVTEANIARQLFYKSDLQQYKAEVLIGRINRAFGTDWKCCTRRYDRKLVDEQTIHTANIIISCVDSVAARKEIAHTMSMKDRYTYNYDHAKKYYWIDCGNDVSYGQVYLGTIHVVKQPKSKLKTVDYLKTPDEYFKGLKDEKTDAPSCSLAAALTKQDLFINRFIANYAGQILWTLIREAKISYSGIYFNSKTLQTNPIPL